MACHTVVTIWKNGKKGCYIWMVKWLFVFSKQKEFFYLNFILSLFSQDWGLLLWMKRTKRKIKVILKIKFSWMIELEWLFFENKSSFRFKRALPISELFVFVISKNKVFICGKWILVVSSKLIIQIYFGINSSLLLVKKHNATNC